MNKSERNKEIVKMRSKGMRYQAIGNHFGITRERVRQILGTFGKAGPLKRK